MRRTSRRAAVWVATASLFFSVTASVTIAVADSGSESRVEVDWNDIAIDWKSYDEGMILVKGLGQPGILVFYTTWCPHCKLYSRVFHDAEVVALAKHFVMIRVDRDQHEALNERYARSGSYVPRTLFLDAMGVVDSKVRGSLPDYPHFLDQHDPGELISLMRSQLR